jgi:hypothetical protein
VFRDKKGFLFDAIPIIFGLFIAAIFIVVALILVGKINDGVQEITSPDATRAKAITSDINSDIDWVLDFFFVMLLVAMPLGAMVLAFLNNIPPFFFWVSIGVMLTAIYFGGALGSALEVFAEDTLIGDHLSRVPMTKFVINNFGMYALFVTVIVAAGVFIKTRSQMGYYQ